MLLGSYRAPNIVKSGESFDGLMRYDVMGTKGVLFGAGILCSILERLCKQAQKREGAVLENPPQTATASVCAGRRSTHAQ